MSEKNALSTYTMKLPQRFNIFASVAPSKLPKYYKALIYRITKQNFIYKVKCL